MERFKNMPTQAKKQINFKNAICLAVRITGEPCAGLQEGRWDLLHPASIPGELIPPQLCLGGCVCMESRLIPENTVLGREELSQTIESHPMENPACPGGFLLASCPPCHCLAMNLLSSSYSSWIFFSSKNFSSKN